MAFLKGLLDKHKPDVVFNVVESVFGAGIYSSIAPRCSTGSDVPYTGRDGGAFRGDDRQAVRQECAAASAAS